MVRNSDPPSHELSSATRAELDSLPPNNIFRTLAHADAAFPSLMKLTASLWNDAVLSQRHHIEVARIVGITDVEINAIDVGRLDEGGFGEADRLLLMAVPSILAHRRSDDAAFADLNRVFSQRELIELHLVVGLYATIAGIVTDFDVPMDDRSGAFELEHDGRGPRLGV